MLEAQKKYCSRALLLALFLGFALIVVGYKPAGKGLILGTLFSVINFLLMGLTVPATIGKNRGQIFGINLGSLTFRMFILAIPFLIALKTTFFNLGSTVTGVFMVQIVILLDNIASPLLLLWLKKDSFSGEL